MEKLLYEAYIARQRGSFVPVQLQQLDQVARVAKIDKKICNLDSNRQKIQLKLRSLQESFRKTLNASQYHSSSDKIEFYIIAMRIIIDECLKIPSLSQLFEEFEATLRRTWSCLPIKEIAPVPVKPQRKPRRVTWTAPSPRKKVFIEFSPSESKTLELAKWTMHVAQYLNGIQPSQPKTKLTKNTGRITQGDMILRRELSNKTFFENIKMQPDGMNWQSFFTTYCVSLTSVLNIISTLSFDMESSLWNTWSKLQVMIRVYLNHLQSSVARKTKILEDIRGKIQNLRQQINESHLNFIIAHQKELHCLTSLSVEEERCSILKQECQWTKQVDGILENKLNALKTHAEKAIWVVEDTFKDSCRQLPMGSGILQPKAFQILCSINHLLVISKCYSKIKLDSIDETQESDPKVVAKAINLDKLKTLKNLLTGELNVEHVDEDIQVEKKMAIYDAVNEYFRSCVRIKALLEQEPKKKTYITRSTQKDVTEHDNGNYHLTTQRPASVLLDRVRSLGKDKYVPELRKVVDTLEILHERKTFTYEDLTLLPIHLSEMCVLLRNSEFEATAWDLTTMIECIAEIYQKKSEMNKYYLERRLQVPKLHQFTYDLFLTQTDTARDAETKFATLCLSIQENTKGDEWLALFSSLIGLQDQLPEHAEKVFFFCREIVLQTCVAPRQNIDGEWDEVGVSDWTLLQSAQTAVQMTFEDKKEKMVTETCDLCENMSTKITLCTQRARRRHVTVSSAIHIEAFLLLVMAVWREENVKAVKALRTTLLADRLNADRTVPFLCLADLAESSNGAISRDTVSDLYIEAIQIADKTEMNSVGYINLNLVTQLANEKLSATTPESHSWARANHYKLSQMTKKYKDVHRPRRESVLVGLSDGSTLEMLKQIWKSNHLKLQRDIQKLKDSPGLSRSYNLCLMRQTRLEELIAQSSTDAAWQAYQMLLLDIKRGLKTAENVAQTQKSVLIMTKLTGKLARTRAKPPGVLNRKKSLIEEASSIIESQRTADSATVPAVVAPRRKSLIPS